MDIHKIKLLINTVKYLKPIQIYYRLYYYIRNRISNKEASKRKINEYQEIKWKSNFHNARSYSHNSFSFEFLNLNHSFPNQIDWNLKKFGKLWTYNLNYFDFLCQEGMTKEIGLSLIYDYLKNDSLLVDGKEPYPISLRGINWVKFLSEHKIKDDEIDQTLFHHYNTLLKNLEFHLLGNHLLENAFSLLFGAYYFQDNKLYRTAKKLLISELNEQILKDGAHFELSPMYHQILFSRLLDCIQLIKLNVIWKNDELLSFLEKKATDMNSWLYNITYRNGEIPMVNDATYNIAPKSALLFSYAYDLGIMIEKLPLSDSGYRKVETKNYELFLDVGNIGPNYQPGHAHSDSLSFELTKDEIPIFVDTGITTYEKNTVREIERSTQSHNTVQIGNKEQTEVWGGFRVANRAKIISLKEKDNLLEVIHDGYKRQNIYHKRSFYWQDDKITLCDDISRSSQKIAKAFFHLHSSIKKPKVHGNKVLINDIEVVLEFDDFVKISIGEYSLSEGYNKTKNAYKIIVTFDQKLTTNILL